MVPVMDGKVSGRNCLKAASESHDISAHNPVTPEDAGMQSCSSQVSESDRARRTADSRQQTADSKQQTANR